MWAVLHLSANAKQELQPSAYLAPMPIVGLSSSLGGRRLDARESIEKGEKRTGRKIYGIESVIEVRVN